MTQEATGRCNDEALPRVVAAIIGRLTPADRQRIEAAEAQADHAGLHLGASAQASADTMRRKVIGDAVARMGDHDKAIITEAMVDAVLSLPEPDKAAISETVRRALMP